VSVCCLSSLLSKPSAGKLVIDNRSRNPLVVGRFEPALRMRPFRAHHGAKHITDPTAEELWLTVVLGRCDKAIATRLAWRSSGRQDLDILRSDRFYTFSPSSPKCRVLWAVLAMHPSPRWQKKANQICSPQQSKRYIESASRHTNIARTMRFLRQFRCRPSLMTVVSAGLAIAEGISRLSIPYVIRSTPNRQQIHCEVTY